MTPERELLRELSDCAPIRQWREYEERGEQRIPCYLQVETAAKIDALLAQPATPLSAQEVFDNWSAYLRPVDREDFKAVLVALAQPATATKPYDVMADAVNEIADAASEAFRAADVTPGEWDGDNIVQDVKRGIVACIEVLASRSALSETRDISAIHQFLGPNSGLTVRDVAAVLDAADKVRP